MALLTTNLNVSGCKSDIDDEEHIAYDVNK